MERDVWLKRLDLAVACVPTLCTYTNVFKTIGFVAYEVVAKCNSKDVSITTQHPINGRNFTSWNVCDSNCAQARLVNICLASVLLA